jgi:hypothetical protein
MRFSLRYCSWTVIIVRLMSARATLGARTLPIYLLQGTFFGAVGMRLIQHLFDPYMWLVSLLAPLPILLIDRLSRVTSGVADAFLLALAIGFGFDLCGAPLAASPAPQALTGLSRLPPWQFSNDRGHRLGFEEGPKKKWIIQHKSVPR